MTSFGVRSSASAIFAKAILPEPIQKSMREYLDFKEIARIKNFGFSERMRPDSVNRVTQRSRIYRVSFDRIPLPVFALCGAAL
jgi:hypothetical protein